MKNNKKNHHICTQFWVVTGCLLATLLLTTPCNGQDVQDYVKVGSGEKLDMGTGYAVEHVSFLIVYGTVNLYPGAYVEYFIQAHDGSTINIFGGQFGEYGYIFLDSGEPSITVYGTDFAVGGVLLGEEVSEFTPVYANEGNLLTGTYGDGTLISLRFYYYSNVPVQLEVLRPEVEIDIKPGSDVNPINLKSKGVVPVAVLTTAQFDAKTIDWSTVQFAGATPVQWTLEDVDSDGDDDMLFHFRTQDLDLTEDSTKAVLTGQVKVQLALTSSIDKVNGGTPVYGTDKVYIKSSKK